MKQMGFEYISDKLWYLTPATADCSYFQSCYPPIFLERLLDWTGCECTFVSVSVCVFVCESLDTRALHIFLCCENKHAAASVFAW